MGAPVWCWESPGRGWSGITPRHGRSYEIGPSMQIDLWLECTKGSFPGATVIITVQKVDRAQTFLEQLLANPFNPPPWCTTKPRGGSNPGAIQPLESSRRQAACRYGRGSCAGVSTRKMVFQPCNQGVLFVVEGVTTADSRFGTRFSRRRGTTRWQVRSEGSGSCLARAGPAGEPADFRARSIPRSQWDIRDGRRRRGLCLHRWVGRVAVAGQQSRHRGLARSRVDPRRARTPRCDRTPVGGPGSGDAQHRGEPPGRR